MFQLCSRENLFNWLRTNTAMRIFKRTYVKVKKITTYCLTTTTTTQLYHKHNK